MPEGVENEVSGAVDREARYAAFLSYAHADEEFGDWLHKRLETYEIPSPLAGSPGPAGAIGRRLGKVFRDRVELSAAHDLGAEIRKALEQSGALIVICSPRSATSRYVNEEIRYFKQLGRGRRILAAIIDGEPHAERKPGGSAADECFPPALIYRLGAGGAISATPEANEPVAADFRPGKDGRENGALKLIAGLLGVGLDELVQRERQAEQRRRLRANIIAGAMAALALGAVAAGGVAFWQRDVAQQNEQRARDLLERVFAERSWDAMRRGDHELATRYALAGWRAAPGNAAEYRAALGAALHGGAHALPLRGHQPGGSTASFSPDGTRIVTASADRTARVLDAESGREIAVLRGHELGVLSAAFSPDGARVVTGSADRTARVWDAESGREIAVLRGHKKGVNRVAFNRDGTRILTTSYDRTARLWDAAGAREIAHMRGQEGDVHGAAFSPDGTRLLTTSWEHEARVWDAASGREIMALPTRDRVLNAAFSADGTRIVTTDLGPADGKSDSSVRIFDAASGREIAAFHVDRLWSAVFSPDGTRIATVPGYGRTARVFDAASGREIHALNGHVGNVWTAAFTPDGTRILTTSDDGTVRVWDAVSGQGIAVLHRQEEGDVLGRKSPWERGRVPAAFSPDGTRILTSKDGTAYVWHVALGREIAVLRGHGRLVSSAAFSPDGRRIVTASSDGTARVWDAASGREAVALRMNSFNDTEARAVFSRDGTRVVTVSGQERVIDAGRLRPLDGTARVWDAASGQEIAVLRGHADDVRSAAFSPDGTRVVTASEDRTARVWDAASGRELLVLRGHQGRVLSATFSPDAAHILTASSDVTVRVWDAASGREIAVLGKVQDNYVDSRRRVFAAFSPDGKRIVTVMASWDGVHVWDAASGKEIAASGRFSGVVHSVMFSPDGTRIVTASYNTARVWDATSGREIAVLRGHEDNVVSAGFSPDGTRIVTASWDYTARVWDAASGREIAALRGHDDKLVGAAFSPDGTHIVTASWDQTARVWNARYLTMPMQSLAAQACLRLARPLPSVPFWRRKVSPRRQEASARRQKNKDAVVFSELQIAADPLIRELWLRDGRGPRTDICEGVPTAAMATDAARAE